MINLSVIFVLVVGHLQHGYAQYYPWPAVGPYGQNGTVPPYPYQTALGLNPSPGYGVPNPQNMGIPYGGVPGPYPYPAGYGMPNVNQNAYYALLAQQGRPAYPFPGYPQPQGFGYPQLGYPATFGQPGGQYPQQPNQDPGQQPPGDNTNVKTEILDVSPEYQRQILGWPEESSSTSGQNGNCVGSHCHQGSPSTKPRYAVDINTKTSNVTNIPMNLTKPIINEKRFVTSIRRTFVYDSSKPENIKPINIHIINGQHVTTTAPPETTVNEDVQETLSTSSVKPSGRRFMDVPKSCPKGSLLAHNGECIAPFEMRNPTKNADTTMKTGR